MVQAGLGATPHAVSAGSNRQPPRPRSSCVPAHAEHGEVRDPVGVDVDRVGAGHGPEVGPRSLDPREPQRPSRWGSRCGTARPGDRRRRGRRPGARRRRSRTPSTPAARRATSGRRRTCGRGRPSRSPRHSAAPDAPSHPMRRDRRRGRRRRPRPPPRRPRPRRPPIGRDGSWRHDRWRRLAGHAARWYCPAARPSVRASPRADAGPALPGVRRRRRTAPRSPAGSRRRPPARPAAARRRGPSRRSGPPRRHRDRPCRTSASRSRARPAGRRRR